MVLGWTDGKNKVIDALVARIEALESNILQLQDENKKKDEKIAQIENELKKSNSTDCNNTYTSWANMLIGGKKTETQINILNAVGKEQKQRANKENNIIIFGLPTSSLTTATASEIVQDDTKKVCEILNDMGIKELSQDIKKLERFKPIDGSSKPPPIRIEFNASANRYQYIPDIQAYVLKAAKLLKNSASYKNIGVSNDLTDSQLIQQKQLIKKRTELNSALNGTEDYRYGIRGDRVVKVAKSSNQNGNSS